VQIEDVTLTADRGKLRLILENLLSNAVKYSPKGGSIHLRAGAAGEALVIDVADSGSGIPLEDRAHIFDAFYTGRAAKGSSLKGTGIGLSVVMECVAAHGGKVEIIDGTYTGAHFRITMPIRPAGNTSPASADSKERRAHAA
jgi:two-component system sensor histidine kinase GlrK